MSNPFSLFKLPPPSQSKERKPSSQSSTTTQRRRPPRPTRFDESGVDASRTEQLSPSTISPCTRYPSRLRNDLTSDPTLRVAPDERGVGGYEEEANLSQTLSPSTSLWNQSQGDRALFTNLRSKLKGPASIGSPTYRDGCQLESPTTASRPQPDGCSTTPGPKFDLRNSQATGGKRKISQLYDPTWKQNSVKISNATSKDNEDTEIRSDCGVTPLRTRATESMSTPLSQPRFLFRQPATSPSQSSSPSSQSGYSPFSSTQMFQPNPSTGTATPQHWLKTVILPKTIGSSRMVRDKGSLSDRLSRVLAQRKSEEVLWRYRSKDGIDNQQRVYMTVQIMSTTRTRGIVIADCVAKSDFTESELSQHELAISQRARQRLRLGFATYSSNSTPGSRSEIDDIDLSRHSHGIESQPLVVDVFEPLLTFERCLDVVSDVPSEAEIMLICTRWKVRAHPSVIALDG